MARQATHPHEPVGDYEYGWREIAEVRGISPQAVQQASKKAIRDLWRAQVNPLIRAQLEERVRTEKMKGHATSRGT